MSERGRVVLIFAAVLLVTGGAGFYFFKIHTPAKELAAAQGEIARWETRWEAARGCLLGKTPGSTKTSEALAIHEMAPDPWDRGRCTPLISKLSRGEADDTGIPVVEKAWTDLDKAAQKAASAFAMHVGSSTTITKDPLPAALDALDQARLDLRKAAKLPPTAQAGTPLVAAQLLPLADGKEPITFLEVEAIPSAHGIVVFGRTASRDVQVTHVTGGAAKVDRIGPSALRAVPDTSWGAAPSADGVRVGTFDAEGAMPSVLSIVTGTTVAAAVGTLKAGVVVAGNDTELIFGRSVESAITIYPAVKIAWAQASVDVDGRAVIIWDTVERRHQARLVDAVADGLTFELPDPLVGQPCLTRDRAWAQTDSGAVAFGGTTPLFRADFDRMKLQGCSANAALFRSRMEPNQVNVCTTQCRKALLPSGAPSASAVTVVDGKLVAIASHGGVLGVWREGAQPTFFSLGEDARPLLAHELTAMAMTDGKVIDVLARGDKTFVVIRIPAR